MWNFWTNNRIVGYCRRHDAEKIFAYRMCHKVIADGICGSTIIHRAHQTIAFYKQHCSSCHKIVSLLVFIYRPDWTWQLGSNASLGICINCFCYGLGRKIFILVAVLFANVWTETISECLGSPTIIWNPVYNDCVLMWLVNILCRSDCRPAPSQWETFLQSNAVSHWLGANLEPALLW